MAKADVPAFSIWRKKIMMDYEIFKEVVAEKFMDCMPDEMQHMEVRVNPARKVNITLDGLCVIDPEKPRNVSPTLYINDMYKEYQKTNDLEGVLNMAAFRMAAEMNRAPIFVPEFNQENAKDSIVFQIINTEMNREMLSNAPHREFQDLSIVYRWVVSVDGDGISNILVTNDLAQQIEMSEEHLYQAAVENTRRMFPPVVKSMNDVIRDMFMKDGMPDDIADRMIEDIPDEMVMWMISNEEGINGAASMLYEDNLHALAERLGTDLYILPSSIHEVIAVSAEMGDPYELARMVQDVNMDQVALNERLSNQVYHYDKDLRKLTLATDVPNRRLDGIVAEPKMIYETGGQSR